eukprot:1159509-Pelagomonas_calceolata.AAC.15
MFGFHLELAEQKGMCPCQCPPGTSTAIYVPLFTHLPTYGFGPLFPLMMQYLQRNQERCPLGSQNVQPGIGTGMQVNRWLHACRFLLLPQQFTGSCLGLAGNPIFLLACSVQKGCFFGWLSHVLD